MYGGDYDSFSFYMRGWMEPHHETRREAQAITLQCAHLRHEYVNDDIGTATVAVTQRLSPSPSLQISRSSLQYRVAPPIP